MNPNAMLYEHECELIELSEDYHMPIEMVVKCYMLHGKPDMSDMRSEIGRLCAENPYCTAALDVAC